MDGWIKLHRKLLDNPVFQNEKLLKMFVWCLLKSASKGYEQLVGLQVVKVEKGQFVYGRFKAANELNMNPSTVNKLLKKLEKIKIIDVKSNNKFSIVTVVNWELYQSQNINSINKVTTKEQQSNNKVTQTRSVKEVIRNDKNKDIELFFESVWNLYPNKKGKAQISDTKKKELQKVGLEILQKCIDRYVGTKEEWKEYQNGSTFFNTGYVDYLDENFEEPPKVKQKPPQKKSTKDNFEQREYTDEFLESLYFNAKEEKR